MPRKDLIPPTPSAEAYAVDADQGDVFTKGDPFALFEEWFMLAKEHEPNDPNAMSLATVDGTGLPDVRVVLMKDFSTRGVSFFSNGESAKGRQLAANGWAAINFHWKSIRRQVRFRGEVAEVSAVEADDYFSQRARGAQIGAWASDQSRPLPSEGALEHAVQDLERRYEGKDVPRPPHWTGYRLRPSSIEFWVNRPYRLHDRLLFARQGDGPWETSRLYP
ncbi:MAG: pyridoxamine 5'-phosphate oxidase [Pseudomonadota bacterium]